MTRSRYSNAKNAFLQSIPWVEKLVWLMDGAIPIGRWSIGLDGFLGLIPGFGDVVGALISMLIVMRAVQSGIPR